MMDEKVRCACYTRKSVENATLDRDFNSLVSQREACENYIASQKGKGWICLSDHYDDGGYSGGNMNRPAMQRLKADPMGAIRNAGYNVPDELAADPRATVMHLIQTGQVKSPMLQRIMPMIQGMNTPR